MQATVIDPADMEGLESALNKNKVSGYAVLNLSQTLFFEKHVNMS